MQIEYALATASTGGGSGIVAGYDDIGIQDISGQAALDRYRPWFYAAAVYNLVWGIIAILFPDGFFRLIRMPKPNYPTLWQVIGMMVMVYAPAYWWVGR